MKGTPEERAHAIFLAEAVKYGPDGLDALKYADRMMDTMVGALMVSRLTVEDGIQESWVGRLVAWLAKVVS